MINDILYELLYTEQLLYEFACDIVYAHVPDTRCSVAVKIAVVILATFLLQKIIVIIT